MDDSTGPALADNPLFAGYQSADQTGPAETAGLPVTAGDQFQRLSTFDRPALEGHRDALPTHDVDWSQVVELRRLASAAITGETEALQSKSGTPLTETDRVLLGRSLIRRIVGDHVRALHRAGAELWSTAQEETYVQAVEDAVFRYGRLQPLLHLPDVENIEINGWDCVMVQYGDGRRERMPPVADSDAELVDAIRFLGQNGQPSRPFDDAHPTLTLALGDRFRLHAIGFGLSHRPSVVIRQHTLTTVTLGDLARAGTMPNEVARFLDAAVLARKSIVISGDQGAGKTTLLRALISSIPITERFGTLETDYELMTHLQPGRHNVLALQSRVGHGETAGGSAVGEFGLSDLMPEALRQNLSRLIVGEVRGREAAAMFEAAQTGLGTMSTTHSHSAESTMDRLASRVAQGGVLTIDEAYRQIALNVDLLIHIRLVDETWKGGIRRRYLSEIRQLTRAIENNRPVTHLTYQADPSASGPAGYFPDPDFEAELLPFRRQLPDAAEGSPR
ncbi:CpaF family protein [Microlunatus speluncae]|uniref:CpaF family protein n=1 Tax=Microlunatus speluncae TaxID=2594267 RepID=UPI0012667BF3|nr:CpaF/VirB11 family protein [Microlunatus speluncae]